MEEFDCKKCLHEKVCALWASRESQNASCFCTDGCDYFTPTLTPPNEALTLEDAKKERYIWFTPLNDWAKVTPFGVLFFGSEELMNWETLCEEWGYRFKAYRRPPEVSP